MDYYGGNAGGYAYPATIPAASCSSSSGIPSGNGAAFYSLPMPNGKGRQNKNGKRQNGNGGEEFERKTNGNGGVKVPSDKYENRALKEAAQFEEDDNEDIAYLNFRLIWPLSAISAFSVVFFLFAFFSMELIDHLSFERFALNQLLFLYGKTIGFCNNTFPYEPGMWPSFLRQVELKVLSNVSFRVAVCVPMAVRIFVAFIIRNSSRDQSLVYRNPILYWLNELSGPIAIVEAFSLALFSIITIRFDYPNLYKAMFGSFIFSATLYMFIRTMLSFSTDKMEQIDLLTGMGRLLCCLLFTWTGSQLFQNHQRFIHSPGCHGYVSPGEALTEYIAILSYGLFSLLQLVDVRDVQFICYPRSCSGECEPLRPENFRVPGGKFEHCRAFEWVQRRNMTNDNLNEFGEQIVEEEEFPAKFSAYRTAKIIHPQMAGGN